MQEKLEKSLIFCINHPTILILDKLNYLLYFNFGTFDSFCGWPGQKLSVQCM